VLVNTGRELVLFDTGNGNLSRDIEAMRGRLPPGELLQRLADLGHKPEDIDVVVTTHGHPDHIGGLIDQGKPVFPNAAAVHHPRSLAQTHHGANRARNQNGCAQGTRHDRTNYDGHNTRTTEKK